MIVFREFDYIIVGAGSAGCITASIIAQNTHKDVLLIEAGSMAEKNPETLRADGYKHAFINDFLMWERFSSKRKNTLNRRLFMGSGRGFGGSGSINGMVYTRGAELDYKQWPKGWEWKSVIEDFEKIESFLRPNKRPMTSFTKIASESAVESGFRISEDLNDGDLSGVMGHEWMNYENEFRRSSYVAFLKEKQYPNLTLMSNKVVSKIKWSEDKLKAISIEIISTEKLSKSQWSKSSSLSFKSLNKETIKIKESLILSAGALETPKILMLSGVGPQEVLNQHEIDIIKEVEGVGKNMQDHPNVTLFFKGKSPTKTFYPQLYGFYRVNKNLPLPDKQSDTCYVFYPASSSLFQAVKRMLPTLMLPELLYRRTKLKYLIRFFIDIVFKIPFISYFVSRIYAIVIILGKPLSLGQVKLRSKNPFDQAEIDCGYFQDEDNQDIITLLEGIKLSIKMSESLPLKKWGNKKLFPFDQNTPDEKIIQWIKKNVMTTYHYAGTCRMGNDKNDPVDPNHLKLKGFDNVYISDASVIPNVPVSAMNAPSMLIGFRVGKSICHLK